MPEEGQEQEQEIPTGEEGGQEEVVNNEVIEAEGSTSTAEATEGGEDTPEGEEENEVETEGDEEVELDDIPDDTPVNRGIKKRIGKLNTKIDEEKERADSAEFELAQIKVEKDGGAEVLKEVPAFDKPRPTQDGFETYEEYEDAFFDWKDAGRKHEDAVQYQKSALENQQHEDGKNFDKRAEVVKKEHKDFDEVATSKEMLTFYGKNPDVRSLVESSEFGPEIALHFGKNKDVAVNIASLPPLQAAKAIGRLEANLSTAPKKKNVSKAPTPINPVKGGGGGHIDSDTDSDKLSTDEWMKREEAKTRKKLGG